MDVLPTPPSREAPRDTFRSLDAEWRLLEQQGSARAVQGWLVDAGVLEDDLGALSLNGLREILRKRDRAQGSVHSDRWLTVLLQLTQGGGDAGALAARFVTQAMVPSAVRTAQRLVTGLEERAEIAQVVAACLWQVIATYPLTRRPVRIASNIALETVHLATREMVCERAGADGRPPHSDELADLEADPAGLTEKGWVSQSASGLRLVPDAADESSFDVQSQELLDLLVWAVGADVIQLDAARDLVRLVEDQVHAGVLRRPGVQESARARKARSRTVQRLRAAVPQFLAEAA